MAQNLFRVAVVESVGELSDVLGRARLVEAAVRLFLKHLVHFSSRGKLQNEVDPEVENWGSSARHSTCMLEAFLVLIAQSITSLES